jgi:hypothetical protein
VVKTPSPYWVERGLHHRLGRKRLRGEWFVLDENELDESISLAEQLAEEAFKYIGLIEQADVFANTVSNGQVVSSTQDAYDWLDRLSQAHAKVKACQQLSDAYGSVYSSLSDDEKEVIEDEELIVIESYIHRVFDREGFTQAHPEILEKFISIQTSVGGPFRPKYIDYSITELDRDLAQFEQEFREACQQVLDGTLAFTDLGEIHRDLEGRQNAYEWEKTIADVNLRSLCGINDGIEGLCTWKRSVKEKETLDEEGLQSDHPNEYQKFLTVEARTRQKTKKRPRRKISA